MKQQSFSEGNFFSLLLILRDLVNNRVLNQQKAAKTQTGHCTGKPGF